MQRLHRSSCVCQERVMSQVAKAKNHQQNQNQTTNKTTNQHQTSNLACNSRRSHRPKESEGSCDAVQSKRAGTILTIPGQPSSSAALNRQWEKNSVNSSRLLQAFGHLNSAVRPAIGRNLFGTAIAHCLLWWEGGQWTHSTCVGGFRTVWLEGSCSWQAGVLLQFLRSFSSNRLS